MGTIYNLLQTRWLVYLSSFTLRFFMQYGSIAPADRSHTQWCASCREIWCHSCFHSPAYCRSYSLYHFGHGWWVLSTSSLSGFDLQFLEQALSFLLKWVKFSIPVASFIIMSHKLKMLLLFVAQWELVFHSCNLQTWTWHATYSLWASPSFLGCLYLNISTSSP